VLFLVSGGWEEGLEHNGVGRSHHTYISVKVESAIFCDIWLSEHITNRKGLGTQVSCGHTRERTDVVCFFGAWELL
jgi:hypothetical protein